MSKVYLLARGTFTVHDADIAQIIGVVSREIVAIQWKGNENYTRRVIPIELDDPELLNRIAIRK